jgi:two-component system LytT family response regulator
MKLRTVVADDEHLARNMLKSLLAEDPFIEITGECRNGLELVSFLKTEPVDLLFLDIQMPGSTGFEVMEQIGAARMPPTIFVTAHSEYALQAFDVHAVDYLTKPIDPLRLRFALEHVRERIASRTALTTNAQVQAFLSTIGSSDKLPKQYVRRFVVPDGPHEAIIQVTEIDWIEAADYYSSLHVGSKTYMLHQTTKTLADSLDPAEFVRVHRSTIVNIDRVKHIIRDGRSESWVVLSNGQRLRMSKTGWQSLLAANRIPSETP